MFIFLRYHDIFYNFKFEIDTENIKNNHDIDIKSNC